MSQIVLVTHNPTPHDDHEIGNAWYDTLLTSCVKKHTLKKAFSSPKAFDNCITEEKI